MILKMVKPSLIYYLIDFSIKLSIISLGIRVIEPNNRLGKSMLAQAEMLVVFVPKEKIT